MFKDCFIICTGVEGSGKSSLSINLCQYIDKSFKEDMFNRIAFTEDDIYTYNEFIKMRIAEREQIFKPLPKCFVFDEGQNLFFSRTAMNKTQKELIKKIRTQRFTLSTIFINTPNISELDKSLLNRADIVLCVSRDGVAYGYYREFGRLYGSLDYFIDELKKIDHSVRSTPENFQELAKFDFYGKVRYSRELYLEYEKVKIEKAKLLFSDDLDDEEEVKKKKEKKEKKIKINYEITEFYDEEFFEIPTPKFYKNCYYNVSTLSKMLGIKESTLKRRLSGVNSIKKGRSRFYKAEDVLKALGIES